MPSPPPPSAASSSHRRRLRTRRCRRRSRHRGRRYPDRPRPCASTRSPRATDAVAVDVSDTDAVEQAVREAVERHGGLDAVVTAAGIDTPAPIDAISSGNWEKIVAST